MSLDWAYPDNLLIIYHNTIIRAKGAEDKGCIGHSKILPTVL